MEIVFFLTVLFALSINDIKAMVKNKNKKEISLYIVLVILSGAFGVIYLMDPYRQSFSYFIIKLLNIKGY